jgi:hypothetical protein
VFLDEGHGMSSIALILLRIMTCMDCAVSVMCPIYNWTDSWLIREIDDVSSLYVNVHRDLRFSARFVACDAQQMDRGVLLNMLGRRVGRQADQRRRCWSLRSRERDTCFVLNQCEDIRLFELLTEMSGVHSNLFRSGFLRLALAGDEEPHSFGDPLRNSALFDADLGAIGALWLVPEGYCCARHVDGTSSAIRLRRGPRSQARCGRKSAGAMRDAR